MTSMKGVLLSAPGKFSFRTDLPIPEPGPGEVRLRVAAASVCAASVCGMGVCGMGVERFGGGLAQKVVLSPHLPE